MSNERAVPAARCTPALSDMSLPPAIRTVDWQERHAFKVVAAVARQCHINPANRTRPFRGRFAAPAQAIWSPCPNAKRA